MYTHHLLWNPPLLSWVLFPYQLTKHGLISFKVARGSCVYVWDLGCVWRAARTEGAVRQENPQLPDRHTCPADLEQSPQNLLCCVSIRDRIRFCREGEKTDQSFFRAHVRLDFWQRVGVHHSPSNLWDRLWRKQADHQESGQTSAGSESLQCCISSSVLFLLPQLLQ